MEKFVGEWMVVSKMKYSKKKGNKPNNNQSRNQLNPFFPLQIKE